MTTRRRLVGVLPAAGHATRLQPLEGSKELLHVNGRPVMDYLVERMTVAGCDELVIVTRPEKRDVIEYASRIGASVVEGRPPTVTRSLLLGMRGLAAEDVVLFGFPDTIWEPSEGFVRMLAALDDETEAVLGIFGTPDLQRSDVVVLGPDGLVERIQVKPREPASDRIWGCAAARRRTLDALHRFDEAGHLFDELARARKVKGVALSDTWLDIGTPEALAAAGVRP